jgi:hypothetical protein
MTFEKKIVSFLMKFLPKHILGPCPKGMKVPVMIFPLFFEENLSGSNFSGSGKSLGSMWNPAVGMYIAVPFGTTKLDPGIG